MSTASNPQPSEEVDLGQLFKIIGNGFRSLFQFIGSIFKQLFLAFVWLVFFLKKRAIILLIAAAVGLALGLVLNKTSLPIYKSSISVKQNYPTGQNLYGSIEYYNGLLKDRDYEVLGRVLGIGEDVSNEIVEFSIEPIITDNDRVVMFDQYITELDSLAASKVEYEDFIDNIEDYKHRNQQISIKSTTRVNFKSVFANIVDNINSNSFFKNEKAKDIFELEESKLAIEKALVQSDSLQRTYKRVLEQQMDAKSGAEIGITFEGDNDIDKTREYDLYLNDIELRKELVDINRRLNDIENIVDAISSKQESGFVDNTKEMLGMKLSSRNYYPALFFILAFVVLLGMEFFKFIEKYKPEQ
ncbi:MAG: hypothetical protein O3C41_01065 [Bacteroidetes bacterium]|nr:hypothetical protein [Bacteroidota bacterium]MDA1175646.1 hypothetical protein [Bacteroidota bacterium]